MDINYGVIQITTNRRVLGFRFDAVRSGPVRSGPAQFGSIADYLVSEFRQDYLGNYTLPFHPLATSILTSQTQAILSEGDGDKIVRDERKILFSVRFGLVRFSPVQFDPMHNKSKSILYQLNISKFI